MSFIGLSVVLDNPLKEDHSVRLDEAHILHVLKGKLASYSESLFPDQTVLVWADVARSGTPAEFLQVAPVELQVTHLAFRDAVKQKAFVSFFFFFLTKYFIVWIEHIEFIHSSADGHWGCVHFAAIITNAAVNICGQVFVWPYIFISFRYIPGNGMPGSYANYA